MAAAMLKRYVSAANLWMVQNHTAFQGYCYAHLLGGDRNGREAFREHPYFHQTEEFCRLYDQSSFDPHYDNMSLTAFEPTLHRVLDQVRPRHMHLSEGWRTRPPGNPAIPAHTHGTPGVGIGGSSDISTRMMGKKMISHRPIFPAPTDTLRPVGTLLTDLAAADPERPAIIYGDEVRTRLDLEVMSNRLAREMGALGVRQGDIVMILLPTSADYHAFTFATWKLGAVPSPVSPKLPDRELHGLIDLANPALIVGVDPQRASGRKTLPLGHRPNPELSAEPLPEVLGPHWKASTSGGSTGRPKIIVDHVPAAFDPNTTMLGIKQNDIILHPAPMYHNAPFAQTHMGLYWGAQVVLMPKFDPHEWMRLVERHSVQWAYLVPTMMSRIIKIPADERAQFDLSSLEMVMHMAAACPVWLKQAWIDWLGPDLIWEIYGSTESTGGTVISGREWLTHKGSVGRPDPSRSTLRVLREDGSECAPGEIGELYFRPTAGRGATYHYLGAEAKSNGEYETLGDLGHVDEDGFLYLADRRVDMIVSGGANIFPAEVEAALEQRADVVAALVVGLPDDDLGARAHALIQLADPDDRPDAENLYTYLKDHLVSYKLPYTFEFITDTLRDDAGKSRRLAIREECSRRLADGAHFELLRPVRNPA